MSWFKKMMGPEQYELFQDLNQTRATWWFVILCFTLAALIGCTGSIAVPQMEKEIKGGVVVKPLPPLENPAPQVQIKTHGVQ